MQIEAESGKVLRLAMPMVVVQFGIMLQGVVDTMMLGRVSKEALAAGGLGSALSFAVLGGFMGVLFALDPLVAQDFGAGRLSHITLHLRRGLILAFGLACLGMVVLPVLGANLHWFGQSEAIKPLARDYLVALVPGVLPLLWFSAFRRTLQAMNVVRPAVIAIVLGNLFNVVANYALVFGHLGFPRLEIVGSGLATSASRWVVLVVLVCMSRDTLRGLDGGRGEGGSHERVLHAGAFLGMLRIGLPIALHQSLELWLFGVVGLMMGSMGTLEFAGHQIALSLASLSFMIPLGISSAASTRVGNAIGRGDKAAAIVSAKVTLALGTAAMTISALGFALLPRLLARAFTPEQTVIEMATLLLPIAAVFQLADGVQVVSAGVLRGIADTARPALYAFLGFWVLGLPLGWTLAFPLGMGPRGLWWGLSAGLLGVSVLLVRRIVTMFRMPGRSLQLAVEEEAEEEDKAGLLDD